MTGSILLASESAETHALAEAITALRSAPGGTEELAKQIDLLTARCQSYPAETRQLWDWFEAQEPCGAAEDVSEVVEEHLRLLDERIGVVQQVQIIAAESRLLTDGSSQETLLAEALSDLIAQRNPIARLWERLNAPPTIFPGPTSTRAERRAAFERGEYEDVGAILERLRNGGPLSKD
jgi:hypothetical protein